MYMNYRGHQNELVWESLLPEIVALVVVWRPCVLVVVLYQDHANLLLLRQIICPKINFNLSSQPVAIVVLKAPVGGQVFALAETKMPLPWQISSHLIDSIRKSLPTA